MKDIGIMVCLMERAFNFSKMVKDLKAISKKINSMVKEYSTKISQLFTEFGKIISSQ